MATPWRLAKSLETLRSEILRYKPGTTVWTIGDEDHQSGYSDHNPNSAGVVCAIDVLGNAGLSLNEFANAVKNSGHPQVKYVIYNRKIWSKAKSSQGWRNYTGSDPHTGHVHVSVGVGSDGRSAPGTYDSLASWGIGNTGGGYVPPTERDNMWPAYGEKGAAVEHRQRQLIYLGYSITRDGDYGNQTAGALKKFYTDISGKTDYDGKVVTTWVGIELDERATNKRQKAMGLKGDKGDKGDPGPAGRPGRDGVDATVSGTITVNLNDGTVS
jgi:hypothetical protein